MGSAVKKVTKPIKKIVKSPLAPIAAGIFGPAVLASMQVQDHLLDLDF